MKKITQELMGKGYSAGTISRINKQLTQEMRAWLEQPIEDNIVYIFLDGLNLPVKRFTVSKESLLVAIGITADGYRQILGVQLGNRESASSWREFFKDLKRRGLKGENLLLGAMDGLSELENAFTEAFPKAKVQRCVVHKLRNIAAKLPRKIQKNCLDLSSIERTFKEFRRRTRQMDSLPNEDCCLRCIYAMSMNLNQSWALRRVEGFANLAEDAA